MKRQNKIIKRDILLKAVLPCLVIVLIILLLGNVIVFNPIAIDEKITFDLLQLILTVIIAFVGFYVYLNRNRDEELNYLELGLNVVHEGKYLKVRTSVFNPTPFDREIYFAFLIISKTEESFLDALNKKLDFTFKDTNSLYNLKNKKSMVSNDFAFIPLPYYFEENVQVGNEKLIYEIPLVAIGANGNINFFDVRFFVFRNTKDLNQYHRSLSSSFGINGNLKLEHLKEIQSSTNLDLKTTEKSEQR